MDMPCTPRARFSRRKFISPSAAAPYRSPLMHNLPEKKVQSPSLLENTSLEMKSPKTPLVVKSYAAKERIHQVHQKFVSPVAISSSYQSPLTCNMPLERKVHLSSESNSLDELKQSTIKLWERNKVLKEKIHHLEQKDLKEEEYKWFIDKLHRYNEIKDVAQTVMERLAIMEQKTIKEVHEDFGMTEQD